MSKITTCPKCQSENLYFDGSMYICPDCFYETTGVEEESETAAAKDSNGTELQDGDVVTVIQDLKVKGSSMVIKRGTKVKSIRLTDNPEEVDCKIEGSSIVLKTCYLKK
jgi:protein PhnA